jgi:hypothetical protein
MQITLLLQVFLKMFGVGVKFFRNKLEVGSDQQVATP